MGTPIWFGLTPLEEKVGAAIAAHPDIAFRSMGEFFAVVGQWAVVFHLPMIYILPVFVLGFMTRLFGRNRSWKEGASAVNEPGIPSMPLSMAGAAAAVASGSWPFFSSFVGALGSFITGSNTVSDLLFAQFQWGMAASLDLPHQIIVSLQAVGGAMGNLVCIHNIVAASATVGLSGMEGVIIKRNAIPLVLYGAVVGVMGLLFSYIFFPNVFWSRKVNDHRDTGNAPAASAAAAFESLGTAVDRDRPVWGRKIRCFSENKAPSFEDSFGFGVPPSGGAWRVGHLTA